MSGPVVPTPVLHETTNAQHVLDSPKVRLATTDVLVDESPKVITKDIQDATTSAVDVSTEVDYGNASSNSLADTMTTPPQDDSQLESKERVGNDVALIDERSAHEDSVEPEVANGEMDGVVGRSEEHAMPEVSPSVAKPGVDHDKAGSDDTTNEIHNLNVSESIADGSATDIEVVDESEIKFPNSTGKIRVIEEADIEPKSRDDTRHEVGDLVLESVTSSDESVLVNLETAAPPDSCEVNSNLSAVRADVLSVGLKESTDDSGEVDLLETRPVSILSASGEGAVVVENTDEAGIPSVEHFEAPDPDPITEQIVVTPIMAGVEPTTVNPIQTGSLSVDDILDFARLDSTDELVGESLEREVTLHEPQVTTSEPVAPALIKQEFVLPVKDTLDEPQMEEDLEVKIVQASNVELDVLVEKELGLDPQIEEADVSVNEFDKSTLERNVLPKDLEAQLPREIEVYDDKVENLAKDTTLVVMDTEDAPAARDGLLHEESTAADNVSPSVEQSFNVSYEAVEDEPTLPVVEEMVNSEDLEAGKLVDVVEGAEFEQTENPGQNITIMDADEYGTSGDVYAKTHETLPVDDHFIPAESAALDSMTAVVSVVEPEARPDDEPISTMSDSHVEAKDVSLDLSPIDPVVAYSRPSVPELVDDTTKAVEDTPVVPPDYEEVRSSSDGQPHQLSVDSEITSTVPVSEAKLDGCEGIQVEVVEGFHLEVVTTSAVVAAESHDQADQLAPEDDDENVVHGDTLLESRSVHSLEAPKEESERPKSPWTPSYSVSTLGGSASIEQDDEELEEESAIVTEDIASTEIVEDSKQSIPEHNILGEEDVETDQSIPDVAEIPTEPNVEIIIGEQHDVCESNSQTDVSGFDQAKSLPVDIEVDTERPKSPWTPSYSVTTLHGSGHSVQSESELEETDHFLSTSELVEEREPVLPATAAPVVFEQPPDEIPAVDDSLPLMDEPESHHLSQDETDQQPVIIVSLEEPVSELELEPVLARDESLVVEIEDVMAERPISPSSPSYSVTVLQRSSPKVLSDLEPLEVHLDSVQESGQEHGTVPDALPASSGLELSSGELAVIESPPLVENAETIDVLEDEASPQSNLTESFIAQSHELESLAELEEGGSRALSSSTKDLDEERPLNWTPSYTVTNLHGSSPRIESELLKVIDVEQLDQLPAMTFASGVEERILESIDMQPSTVMDEQPSQDRVQSADEEDAVAMEKPAVAESDELELHEVKEIEMVTPATLEIPKDVPQRPWTPSYSSYTQGPGSSSAAEADNDSAAPEDDEPQDDFPTRTKGPSENETSNTNIEEFPRLEDSLDTLPKKPSLDLLQPVDPSSSMTSPQRSRYESTASSRFFPGAWFSSPKSPSGEGRASLDEAVGEFVPSKHVAALKEPTVDEISDEGRVSLDEVVGEFTPSKHVAALKKPTVDEISDEEEHQPEEKKSKWCFIM